ncbi:hypothetical protein ACIOHS_00225 [Streptomyces sp. NPDC088253]|uniref:hypothetical protein n=1 Tax=Streptomyces sp. NPDC088253 TaxID=3365846 RepID=UPI00381AECEE
MRTAARTGLGAVIATVWPLVLMSAEANPSHDLVAPKNYPTIQAAAEAAEPGHRIRVRPGVHQEQVLIDKYVSITGSGGRTTTILAPRTLVAGEGGGTSIVEIHNAASAAPGQLAVSGPGSGACSDGALGSGVPVLGGARLDLGHARVTRVTDTPAAPCPHSAVAAFVGDLPTRTGSVPIHDTEISDYRGSVVTVLNERSSATIVDSTVTGHPLSTDGTGFVAGAVVQDNRRVGNHIGVYAGRRIRRPAGIHQRVPDPSP